MDGRAFKYIVEAVQRLRNRNLNVEDYEITVIKRENSILVGFSGLGQLRGRRGSGRVPGFQVEFTLDGEVLKESFVK